ncbi:hypothetical protein [Pseudescherichia vulneris]|uniref:hypothetical protein n=1 Tax=Pseudescherichia vulneris TaxID=566 RepID=UPI001EDE6E5C|nr:hypothetical protein [Pseudescherichia vulneris]
MEYITIEEDQLIIGRYAFSNAYYHFDVIDEVYDLRFDMTGATEDLDWHGVIMGDYFWSRFRLMVRSQPEYLYMYEGINQTVFIQLMKEFIALQE